MKKRKLLFIAALLLFLYSCDEFFIICSLNPFYVEQNIITIPEIEGNWTISPVAVKKDSAGKENSTIWELNDTTTVWTIKQFIAEEKAKDKRGNDSTVFKPMNYYHVEMAGKNPDVLLHTFNATLFRVNKNLYADFMPNKSSGLTNSKLAEDSYFRVHTLAKVNLDNGKLKLSWLGADSMKEMIEQKRVRVGYRWVKETKRLLLTGSSSELTGMIERYADQKRFIDWENQQAILNLTRIK